jgi:hypothetical protein
MQTRSHSAFVQQAIDWGVYFSWLIFFSFLFTRHVPWRDEWQPWLVSAYTENWRTFFTVIRYERHPPLQYLLNKLLLTLVAPTNPLAFRLLPAAFTIVNVYILLFRARLARPWVYLVPFGALLLREYGLLARCYPMGLCFVLLAALAYRKERLAWAYACLAVAAGFHLLFTLFAGAFLFSELWRRRSGWPLWICSAVVGGFFLFQLAPADSVFNSALRLDPLTILKRFLGYWLYGLSGLTDPFHVYRWNGNLWKSASWLAPVIGVPLLIFSFREFWRIGWVAWLLTLPVFLLLSAYGLGDLRHVGYVYVILLFFAIARPTYPQLLWRALSLLMVVASAQWLLAWRPWQNPPAFDLSGAGELRAFLAGQRKTTFVTEHQWLYLPVSAITGQAVYNIPEDRWLAYPYFRMVPRVNNLEQWCTRDLPAFRASHPGRVVVVAAKSASLPMSCAGRKIFESSRPELVDESFTLYLL